MVTPQSRTAETVASPSGQSNSLPQYGGGLSTGGWQSFDGPKQLESNSADTEGPKKSLSQEANESDSFVASVTDYNEDNAEGGNQPDNKSPRQTDVKTEPNSAAGASGDKDTMASKLIGVTASPMENDADSSVSLAMPIFTGVSEQQRAAAEAAAQQVHHNHQHHHQAVINATGGNSSDQKMES